MRKKELIAALKKKDNTELACYFHNKNPIFKVKSTLSGEHKIWLGEYLCYLLQNEEINAENLLYALRLKSKDDATWLLYIAVYQIDFIRPAIMFFRDLLERQLIPAKELLTVIFDFNVKKQSFAALVAKNGIHTREIISFICELLLYVKPAELEQEALKNIFLTNDSVELLAKILRYCNADICLSILNLIEQQLTTLQLKKDYLAQLLHYETKGWSVYHFAANCQTEVINVALLKLTFKLIAEVSSQSPNCQELGILEQHIKLEESHFIAWYEKLLTYEENKPEYLNLLALKKLPETMRLFLEYNPQSQSKREIQDGLLRLFVEDDFSKNAREILRDWHDIYLTRLIDGLLPLINILHQQELACLIKISEGNFTIATAAAFYLLAKCPKDLRQPREIYLQKAIDGEYDLAVIEKSAQELKGVLKKYYTFKKFCERLKTPENFIKVLDKYYTIKAIPDDTYITLLQKHRDNKTPKMQFYILKFYYEKGDLIRCKNEFSKLASDLTTTWTRSEHQQFAAILFKFFQEDPNLSYLYFAVRHEQLAKELQSNSFPEHFQIELYPIVRELVLWHRDCHPELRSVLISLSLVVLDHLHVNKNKANENLNFFCHSINEYLTTNDTLLLDNIRHYVNAKNLSIFNPNADVIKALKMLIDTVTKIHLEPAKTLEHL